MMRKLLVLMSVILLSQVAFAQNGEVAANGVNFFYKGGKDYLYAKYKDNQSSLAQLQNIANSARQDITMGRAHYLIISFITKSQIGDSKAINEASVQASIARAYLKTQYGVQHADCIFGIDTTMGVQDIVRVQLVDSPMPYGANSTIHYSVSDAPSAVQRAVARYNGNVPYVNMSMMLAKSNADVTVGAMSNLDGSLVADVEETNDEEAECEVVSQPVFEEEIYIEEEPLIAVKEFKPVFGLQTNIAYWIVGSPNLGIEFFMGDIFSLEFSGNYSVLPYVMPSSEDFYAYHWNGTMEAKFWVNGSGKYDGFYIGAMGGVGQYDFKFGDRNGNQGEYFTAGLTLGCMVPITKHFGLEFGVSGGYVGYRDTEYEWNGTDNVAVGEKNISREKPIFPTKAEFSLVWKF